MCRANRCGCHKTLASFQTLPSPLGKGMRESDQWDYRIMWHGISIVLVCSKVVLLGYSLAIRDYSKMTQIETYYCR